MTMKLFGNLLWVLLLWKVVMDTNYTFANEAKQTRLTRYKWLKRMEIQNCSKTEGKYGWMHDLRRTTMKPIMQSRKTASTFSQGYGDSGDSGRFIAADLPDPLSGFMMGLELQSNSDSDSGDSGGFRAANLPDPMSGFMMGMELQSKLKDGLVTLGILPDKAKIEREKARNERRQIKELAEYNKKMNHLILDTSKAVHKSTEEILSKVKMNEILIKETHMDLSKKLEKIANRMILDKVKEDMLPESLQYLIRTASKLSHTIETTSESIEAKELFKKLTDFHEDLKTNKILPTCREYFDKKYCTTFLAEVVRVQIILWTYLIKMQLDNCKSENDFNCKREALVKAQEYAVLQKFNLDEQRNIRTENCQHGEFQCASSKEFVCIEDFFICNCKDNCESWKEKTGCKLSQISKVILKNKKGENHYGNVLLVTTENDLGDPICDNSWSDEEAKVVCRELGFDMSTTKAIAVNGSHFGYVDVSYVAQDFRCDGNEASLKDCCYYHLKKNSEGDHNCRGIGGKKRGAGVICVDSKQLELKGKKNKKRKGEVYIGNSPVCSIGWDMNDAQVVCNQLYAKNFIERGGMVPVYKITTKGKTSNKDYFIRNLQCNGSEKLLTDCKFLSNQYENCKDQVAGVECAMCTPKDLIDIVNSIVASSVIDYHKSVKAALDNLKKRCHNWNCLKSRSYPEYCQVFDFLIDATELTSQSFQNIEQVSSDVYVKKLLEEQYTKKHNARLLDDMNNASVNQGVNFWEDLALYYEAMADYVKKKAKDKLQYSKISWYDHENILKDKKIHLIEKISELFEYALKRKKEGKVDGVKDTIHKTLADTLDAILEQHPKRVDLTKLKNIVKEDRWDKNNKIYNVVAKFDEKTIELSNELNGEKIKDTYHSVIARFFDINDKKSKYIDNDDDNENDYNNLMLKNITIFLDEYRKHNHTFKAQILEKYVILIDEIVEDICNLGDQFDQYINLQIVKLCPTVRQNIAILKSIRKDLMEHNKLVLATWADLARAKFIEHKSRILKIQLLLFRINTATVPRAIIKKKAQILHMIHKTALIKDACDLIKYFHYGEDQEFCQKLRRNTANDLSQLSSFDYNKDIICSGYDKTGVFNIQAMIRRGRESLPPGTLDLTAIYSNSSKTSMFQIPDAQWLIDNRWIEKDDINDGPFFVKRLELYYLPLNNKKPHNVKTKFNLIRNLLGKQESIFDQNLIAYHRYQENSLKCRGQSIESPYNLNNCKKNAAICRKSRTEKNNINANNFKKDPPIYPSLMGLWIVKFDWKGKHLFNPEYQPHPVDKLDLKVRAEICFRRQQSNESEKERILGTFETSNNECCAETGPFWYTDKDGNCQTCPNDSKAKLNGHFCGSCPAGFEPSDRETDKYGCRICRKDEYKGQLGNKECQSCGSYSHTDDIKGAFSCIDDQSYEGNEESDYGYDYENEEKPELP